MTQTPVTVRATSPSTGRPVEAALCEADGSCERVWRAAVEELAPIRDAPRVELEISFDD